MVGWIVRGGRALWHRLGGARADEIAKEATGAAERVKDAPLRATVAAGNVLAHRRTPRKIMVDRSLGRELTEAVKEAGGRKLTVRTSQARNTEKLVRKAIAEGCDALIVDGDALEAASKSRGGSRLTLCGIGGTRRGGRQQAAKDAAQAVAALTKGRPGADVGVFRGQGTWMETPGPRASLPDWLQTVESIAKWTAGLGGALAWIGLGKEEPEGSAPGGLDAGASERGSGQGVEPDSAARAGKGTTGEVRTQVTRDASTHAATQGELEAELAAVQARQAQLREALAAPRAAQDAAAAATTAAVGMGTRDVRARRSARAMSATTGEKAPRRNPEQRGGRRKAPGRER